MTWLTAGRYAPEQRLLTNLCTHALPHAPQGRTVYIPEDAARAGQDAVGGRLGFYVPGEAFLRAAAPLAKGVAADPPFYAQSRARAFTLVCGRRFLADGRWTLVPAADVKHWPLNGRFAAAGRRGEGMDGHGHGTQAGKARQAR